jgi:hypothetical protein
MEPSVVLVLRVLWTVFILCSEIAQVAQEEELGTSRCLNVQTSLVGVDGLLGADREQGARCQWDNVVAPATRC